MTHFFLLFHIRHESTIQKLYFNRDKVDERHRHRYEVNPSFVPDFEKEGLMFVGHDEEKQRMEVFELKGHPYYVGVQYHPEYLSRPLCPSPPFLGLILASVNKLQAYLMQGNKLTPRHSSDDSSDENTDTIIPKMNGLNIQSPTGKPINLGAIPKVKNLNGVYGNTQTPGCSKSSQTEQIPKLIVSPSDEELTKLPEKAGIIETSPATTEQAHS